MKAASHFSVHFMLCLLPLALSLPYNLTNFYQQDLHPPHITWIKCSSHDPPGLQCGRIIVPLDHANPRGDSIVLGMARLEAKGPDRRGSLIFNPGGPGTNASFFVKFAAQGVRIFSEELLKHYDIVGLDPRGVGLSVPVMCDPSIWNQRVSTFATDEKSFARLVEHNKAVGRSCKQKTGPLFDHLDTTHAAKDMELVRQALGDSRLNYLGFSYGSQLGGAYAELYPDRVGHMVLDGIVDHSQSETSALVAESSAYESSLNQFFQWCNISLACELHGRDVGAIFDAMIQRADAKQIQAPGCAPRGNLACRPTVSGEDIRYVVQRRLAFFAQWPQLSTDLAEANAGNATGLSPSLATETADRLFASVAIGCQDWAHAATSAAALRYKLQMTNITAPRTGGASQVYGLQTGCIGWPARLSNPPHALHPRVGTAPPILLVNSDVDPQTSIVWATALLGQMPTAVLLTRKGFGHTSYLLYGETSKAMDRFLVEGKTPKPGTMYTS